ncbi:putative FAD-dependent monooxygenase [Colletotrichum chlorophyti]|uniref:Putative FAD-dependent monooxygenase n=1 Tax=Colletotrichum chlorophyti TaxID=708187 RepID=A0A1Q8S5T2_9PEZI|nr:putative FAD-dependent monooxygenase [Colletotrichum chlorophyti]
MANQDQAGEQELPVIIIGAGVSGLLLAQHLRSNNIPFRIFERDTDLTTRGVGWGLTLHWSLPALRFLLPEDLVARLPEAYVDRAAVARGEASAFPFFDLSTGELKGASPRAPESLRIRVTRERLRRLVATDVDIQVRFCLGFPFSPLRSWGKGFQKYEERQDSVVVTFENGSTVAGRALVANTPTDTNVPRPVVLDAPGNTDGSTDKYSCQICISWPDRAGFLGKLEPTDYPGTNAGKIELIRSFAEGWAEPFRSLVLGIPADTDVKHLDLSDYPPQKGLRSEGRVVLMGDAFHAMAMYRGEGANHAILDVLDFAEKVSPKMNTDFAGFRIALDAYEDAVVTRARPGVLASRRACLDAHDWPRISPTSPLLSKREMKLQFDEE